MEEKEYEFVHETIKKSRSTRKASAQNRSDSRTCCGIRSGGVCYLSSDRAGHQQCAQSGKISKVEFPEEKKEVKPQELLTEESVARQEVQRQEAAVEEAKEEAIQSATTAFGIDQYEELYQDLYAYAQDSMDFMVSVIGISEMQDWLQGTFENEIRPRG